MKQIFIYVQHLLGSGHLRRVEVIADYLANDGFGVTVASGGVDRPRFQQASVATIELPGIRSDSTFSSLFDDKGTVVTDNLMSKRSEILQQALVATQPDMLVVESYPFARRQMRKEILALLDAAKNRLAKQVIIACSVRDVIQPKTNQRRIDETLSVIDRYFDFVLVHGDRDFIPFDQTFPQCSKFRDKLLYTGYISRPYVRKPNIHRQANLIVVSAGGGAAGKILYDCAMEAATSGHGEKFDWLMLVGNSVDNDYFTSLQKQENQHIRVEWNRADFRDLLAACACSVSQGGYNTIMDLLVTRTPAVIVPFEGDGEVEQLTRAMALQQQHCVGVLRESQLQGSRLLRLISDCRDLDVTKFGRTIKLDGGRAVCKFARKALSP